jgi:lambda repressor-like predicted transcriptional regulator
MSRTSEYIKTKLKENGHTVRSISSEIDYSYQSVYNVIQDTHHLSPRMAVRMGRVLKFKEWAGC